MMVVRDDSVIICNLFAGVFNPDQDEGVDVPISFGSWISPFCFGDTIGGGTDR